MRKIFSVFLALALSLAVAGVAGAAPVQWTVASGGNDHWYEAVSVPSGIYWSAANTAAQARGGYLATTPSSEENTFVYGLISDSSYWYEDDEKSVGPWLGGYQFDKADEPSGHWRWMGSETWSFTSWLTDEPNNSAGSEDWLHYYRVTDDPEPTWNDIRNDASVRGYIIEWDANPVPLPGAVWLLGSGLLGVLAWRRRA